MRISTEATVILVAVALYLYDSLILLSSNEAILQLGWNGRWSTAFGSNHWKLKGKEPYLPNPFLPHLQSFRLQWNFYEPKGDSESGKILDPAPELFQFIPFVYISAMCLFVLVPIGFFANISPNFLLGAIVMLYMNNCAAIFVLHRLRGQLSISSSQFNGIAFDCIACPPFSVNLMRKLSKLVICNEDFSLASSRLLSAEEVITVNAQCLMRIDEQLDYEEEGSLAMEQLRSARVRFLSEKHT